MNRAVLTAIFLSSALFLTAGKSHATNTAPTAKIETPDNPHYILPGSTVNFDGEGSDSEVPPTGSYDADNGPPYGGGHGITVYHWTFGDEDSDSGPTTSHTYNDADKYNVELTVDDDDDPSLSDDASCTIYVIKVEIYDPAPWQFPKYIGIDTGLTLKANLTPSSATGGQFTWSKVSGPGTATFTPSDESTTSFSADTVGSYTVKVQYTIQGVTCSDTSGIIEVCDAKMIFKAGTPPTETSSITRAESGTFEVVNKDGDPIDGGTYAGWEFDGQVDVSDPAHFERAWGGTIVESGKASCTVWFGITTCKVNKSITVNARSGWSISPTFDPDDESNWGLFPGATFPTFIPGESYNTYENMHLPIIHTHNPAFTDYRDTYSEGQVTSGPNKDVFYLVSSTLSISHASRINQFLKSGATGYPPAAGSNWHEYNEAHSKDADDFLDSTKNHEAYGTGGNRKGHQAFLEDKQDDPEMDSKEKIEDNVASSLSSLRDLTGGEISAMESVIYTAWDAEPAPGDNWAASTMYLWVYHEEVWQWALCSLSGF